MWIGMQRRRWATGPSSTGVTRSSIISLIIYRPAVQCFIGLPVHWYGLHSFFKVYLRVVSINFQEAFRSGSWIFSKSILGSFSTFLDLFVSSMDATKTMSHRFPVHRSHGYTGSPSTGLMGIPVPRPPVSWVYRFPVHLFIGPPSPLHP
jgi:hypothetical protein